jgi:transglutaminase-like putative cysteine protease
MTQNSKESARLGKYLKPTQFIEANNPIIKTKAQELIQDIPSNDDIQKAIKIFYFVRDEIPYHVKNTRLFYSKPWLKASATLQRQKGYCIQKSVLLAALARAIGIPARLHFVDIMNYLTPRKFIEEMGRDLFIYHGFAELYLNGKWIEANVAFDKALCLRKGYPVGEFDGKTPCLFSHFDEQGRKFVEYIKDRGTSIDVPYHRIILTWLIEYGLKRKRKLH